MQTAFLTRALQTESLGTVAEWAAATGFDALEVDVTGHMGGASGVPEGVALVRSHGLEVCALTCFGFLLDSDPRQANKTRETVRATVEMAAQMGGGLVVTFSGRNTQVDEDANYRDLAEYLSALGNTAVDSGVKIALENWPGPRKDFIATTPSGWARLFGMIDTNNVGLNFDPSHLVWQGIDHERALREVADRVFLAHAKDTEIYPETLHQVGYYGSRWWEYRLPGHGVIDWRNWFAALRSIGFDGAVSIEHEDAAWGFGPGTLDDPGVMDLRRDGLVEGLRALQAAGSDSFAPAAQRS
jgi:sugar phosphate isomerase/epimerase